MTSQFNQSLLSILACPADHSALRVDADTLVCENAHRFAIENGVPVFTAAPRRELAPRNMAPCPHHETNSAATREQIDPFVNDWIVNTNGNLYWRARGRLPRYPIPRWPFTEGQRKVLVDIGCSWGRWSIAAARAGYLPIGLDVHIDALEAAGRVSRQLGAATDFLCSDADQLPFRSASVDCVFSYSVLQHINKEKVLRVFHEAARVLKPGGVFLIQLPNTFGLFSLLQQLKRGFRQASQGTFEMRYWSRKSIRQGSQSAGLQDVAIRADGFFSQNPQLSDLDLLSPMGKLIVLASYAGRKAADAIPILTRVADSLWIEAHAPSATP